MSLKRKLDGLEQRSPAAEASQENLRVLPDALRAAVPDLEKRRTLHGGATWGRMMEPFAGHLSGQRLEQERRDRLGAFVPELERVAGRDAVKMFLSALSLGEDG